MNVSDPSTKLVIAIFCLLIPVIAVAQESDTRLNKAIELLEKGEPALGIFSGDQSLNNARLIAGSDIDFALIDMEHGPLDFETLRAFLLGLTDKRAIHEESSLQPNVTPIVRLPTNGRENLQFLAKQALDVGAFGVMYPFVTNKLEALNAVRASRYPQKTGVPDFDPPGIRGRAPANAAWYWGINAVEYVRRADVWPLDPRGEILTIIQIENPEGVENIEEIISVPGVGVIFVGPSDLGITMGYPDTPNAPEIEEAILKVLKACQAKNIPVGITANAGSIERRLKQGFRFITVGGDGGLRPDSATTLELGRKTLGD